jgi:hypothetical protein
MNQHSKRSSQADGNWVNEVLRGATRPVAVVAIVLCVGFAVAMVAIWPSRKPPSKQEMQPQPKAAVQNAIPEPEAAVSPVSVPDDALPDLAEPLERSAARPVSQANPAARQLTDAQVNSPANSPTPVQDDPSYAFSHVLNVETITFEAVNPSTQVAGRMTVTVTGAFRGKRLGDGQSGVGSHLHADQQATFSFVPYYPNSPSYSATVRTLTIDGNTTNDSIHLDFGVMATGSDGSSQRFSLREVVTVTEDGAQVTFGQL